MICGAAGASFGLRHPGQRSQVPEIWRDKYLWHCGAPACRETAEGRWRARFKILAPSGLAPRVETDPPKSPPGKPPAGPTAKPQGDLFGV